MIDLIKNTITANRGDLERQETIMLKEANSNEILFLKAEIPEQLKQKRNNLIANN